MCAFVCVYVYVYVRVRARYVCRGSVRSADDCARRARARARARFERGDAAGLCARRGRARARPQSSAGAAVQGRWRARYERRRLNQARDRSSVQGEVDHLAHAPHQPTALCARFPVRMCARLPTRTEELPFLCVCTTTPPGHLFSGLAISGTPHITPRVVVVRRRNDFNAKSASFKNSLQILDLPTVSIPPSSLLPRGRRSL